MENLLKRKDDHISLALSKDIKTSSESGFDNYLFEHNALPEINFSEIDISTKFLGRKLSMPLIISSITGGGKLSEKINRSLAGLANDFNIGFSVGSQRCAIENTSIMKSFQDLRNYAPNIPILANLGASQLNYGYKVEECKQAVDMIDADALTLHLNPLHEVFQLNGTSNFSDLLSKIEKVCAKVGVPVIIKEVGYGISASVARKLINVGVSIIDVAGTGSISWTKIEKYRSNDIVIQNASKSFENWGIPTAQCIESISENIGTAIIIASGGVNTGIKIAKSIALGASICGNASDFLKHVVESRTSCENYIETLKFELKTSMFCTGCKNLQELKKAKIIKKQNNYCSLH